MMSGLVSRFVILFTFTFTFVFVSDSRAGLLPEKVNEVHYEGKGFLFLSRKKNHPPKKYQIIMDLKRLEGRGVEFSEKHIFEGGKTVSMSFRAVETEPNFFNLMKGKGRGWKTGIGYCFLLKAPGDQKCHFKFFEGKRVEDLFFTIKGNEIFRMGQSLSSHRIRTFTREGLKKTLAP